MGRLAAVVLSLFALALMSLFLGWVTFTLLSATRRAYWRWKSGGKPGL